MIIDVTKSGLEHTRDNEECVGSLTNKSFQDFLVGGMLLCLDKCRHHEVPFFCWFAFGASQISEVVVIVISWSHSQQV